MIPGDHASTNPKVAKTENNETVVTIIPTTHDFIVGLDAMMEVLPYQ